MWSSTYSVRTSKLEGKSKRKFDEWPGSSTSETDMTPTKIKVNGDYSRSSVGDTEFLNNDTNVRERLFTHCVSTAVDVT